jgi:hypothetical protein
MKFNCASIETVVVANNATRGNGKDFTSPIRGITEVYSADGELIAINDEYTWSIEQVKQILLKMKQDGKVSDEAHDIINIYFDIVHPVF